jgi:hypothetical protein
LKVVNERVEHLRRILRDDIKVSNLLGGQLPVRRRPGRPPKQKIGFYLEFAQRYAATESEQQGTSTRERLASEYDTNVYTVARWIAKCRQLDFLPKTKQGRRGGNLIGAAAAFAAKKSGAEPVPTLSLSSPKTP